MSKLFFKFKGTAKLETLEFDKHGVTVLDVKRAIIALKGLGKGKRDFNLVLTDSTTGVSYDQDAFAFRPNTCLVVRRVPSTVEKAIVLFAEEPVAHTDVEPERDEFGEDIYEDESKMIEVMGAAQNYRSVNRDLGNRQTVYGRAEQLPHTRGSMHPVRRGGPRKPAPDPGPRLAAGIPRSFLRKVAADEDTDTSKLSIAKDKEPGQAYVAVPNSREFARAIKRSRADDADLSLLTCRLCASVFRDAVTLPCCYSTFCEECAKQQLAAERCPTCHTHAHNEQLLANRGIRAMVHKYLS